MASCCQVAFSREFLRELKLWCRTFSLPMVWCQVLAVASRLRGGEPVKQAFHRWERELQRGRLTPSKSHRWERKGLGLKAGSSAPDPCHPVPRAGPESPLSSQDPSPCGPKSRRLERWRPSPAGKRISVVRLRETDGLSLAKPGS